jgi:putative DNA-invertase from lambdoid prophage Rac
MKAKPHVAIYARVSTDAQNHASQLHEVRDYVKRRWPTAQLSQYLDKASGARSSREGLDALMAQVRRGKVDLVAVYHLDRLGRSIQHLLQLTEQLRTHRTALVVAAQGIDTSDDNPAGELTLNVLAAVAQFERKIIVQRVRSGLAAARARGVRLGRQRTLDRYVSSVRKLMTKGLSESKIAARLKIPIGSVSAVKRLARNKGSSVEPMFEPRRRVMVCP